MEQNTKPTPTAAVYAAKECDVYCPICRKLLHVEPGQTIPRCCGKPMKIID